MTTLSSFSGLHVCSSPNRYHDGPHTPTPSRSVTRASSYAPNIEKSRSGSRSSTITCSLSTHSLRHATMVFSPIFSPLSGPCASVPIGTTGVESPLICDRCTPS